MYLNSGNNICVASQYGPEVWLQEYMGKGTCNCSPKRKYPLPSLDLDSLVKVYDAYKQAACDKRRECNKEEPRFKCTICDYTTQDRCNFNRHKKIHEQKEGIKCKECSHVFVSKTLLFRHEEEEHGDGLLTQCPFEGCGSKVKNISNHMYLHRTKTEEGFKCGCGKTYTLKQGLVRHQKDKGCVN